MGAAEAPHARVAQLLDTHVERLLELSARDPSSNLDAVSRVLHLVLERFGRDDPALFWEELSSTQQPLTELLAGLDVLEQVSRTVLAETAKPAQLAPLSRALERMIDEIRGQIVRNTRRLQGRAEPREIETARFLQQRADDLLALCARDIETARGGELVGQLLALILRRYLAHDPTTLWAGLAQANEQPMAAVLDALDRLGQAGMRLIVRWAQPDDRPQMWASLERMVDEVRGEYLHMLRLSQQHGRVAELPALEHFPDPLFTVSGGHGLDPVNSAGRRYRDGRAGAHCHQAFFGRDRPCPGCPLPEVLQQWEYRRCPIDARRPPDAETIGLTPYSATHVLAHLARATRSPPDATGGRGNLDRDVLEGIGSGVIFADEQAYVVYANRAAADLVGERIDGLALKDVLPGLNPHADDRQHKLEHIGPNGQEMLIGYRIVPCELDGLAGTLVSLRDISETERMRSDMDKLRRLSEVGRMCAVVAHEIRNPLAGICATLDSIAAEAASAGLDQPLSMVRREVDRLGDLLSSFFAFVRHRPACRAEVDVAPLLERALRAVEPHTRGLQLTHQCDVQEKVWLDGDQIQQLLINLLINAAQATPAGGALAVDARLNALGDTLRLRVTDTGHGMSQQLQSRIFEAFYTTKAGGTGLGLSICYRIASDHGGRIYCESAAGQGTCMTVELPARGSG